jgi:hypothetical protein
MALLDGRLRMSLEDDVVDMADVEPRIIRRIGA